MHCRRTDGQEKEETTATIQWARDRGDQRDGGGAEGGESEAVALTMNDVQWAHKRQTFVADCFGISRAVLDGIVRPFRSCMDQCMPSIETRNTFICTAVGETKSDGIRICCCTHFVLRGCVCLCQCHGLLLFAQCSHASEEKRLDNCLDLAHCQMPFLLMLWRKCVDTEEWKLRD